MLESRGFEVWLERAERTKPEDLDRFDVLIFGASTYGHGLIQEHMGKLLQRLNDVSLAGRKCAVIGLGDDKYDAHYNVESAPILEDFLNGKETTLVVPALWINKNPVPQLEGLVANWADNLANQLQ